MRYLLLLILLLLATCRQGGDAALQREDPDSPVVATVNGYQIRESEIDRQIAAFPEQLQHLGSDQEARAKILQVLIRRHLLSEKAEEMGLDRDPVVADQLIRSRNDILIAALESYRNSHLQVPTEDAINAYFRRHQAEFGTPDQIHARHIVVGSEKEAIEIRRKLAAGADFAALAAANSRDDATRGRGGDLNWFSRGTMLAEFDRAAFALRNTGDISPPVETALGWHLIQLLGRKEGVRSTLEEARDEVIVRMQQEIIEQEMQQMLDDADIEIDKEEYRQQGKSRLLDLGK